MLAWHFTAGDKLRDGRPVPPVGEVLRHKGRIIPCQAGLHASVNILDALKYAPGSMLHRVELGSNVIHHNDDKVVSTERTVLWSVDAKELLAEFARGCALDVIHLWDAPSIVRDYLETGDESLRDAASAAARDAAWDAARDAAWAAAWAAARDAAWAAASAAARAAARDAAWAAAWAAARDAARESQEKRLLDMINKERL